VFELFVYLIMGHALADFALQSEVMATGKNRNRPIDLSKIPPGQTLQTVWPYWLGSHCLIHGGMVAALTGSWELGVAETFAHFYIDLLKCGNVTGIHMDQFLHVLCKSWWVLATLGATLA